MAINSILEFLSLFAGFLPLVLILIIWRIVTGPGEEEKKAAKDLTFQVLVLGDVGRSPRMQYHTASIAQRGNVVEVIGYAESPLIAELVQNPKAFASGLASPPKILRLLPFMISGPLKVLWQILTLVVTLGWSTEHADWLIVQNPPSIPTLAVAAVISWLRGTKLLIDWHNYGWSILAGTRGSNHPFVSVSKYYETLFGRLGNANLTVTDAMAKQLEAAPYNIKSPISVMHDRPANIFAPIKSQTARQHFLARLLDSKKLAAQIVDGKTKLIVSSTSWTPDEDFGMLLDALVQYGAVSLTPILAMITGKGPQKAMYQERIAQLTKQGKLPNITIHTAFLPMEEYATLLAAADLGVCLHMSSSGVDLPMKVVDMFGAGLPVIAYSGYESFGELVKEGVNGTGFRSAGELAEGLTWLLSKRGQEELARLREGAVVESKTRWSEEWNRVVAPVLGLSE